MNKDFLNGVRFNKEVKLKRPKKPPTEKQLISEKKKRRNKRFNKKLMRLVFFLLMVVMLGYVSIISCNGFLSVSAGKPVTIFELIGVFVEGFNEE